MYRVMMISLLAALTYLGTAPTDIDARCGGGNGGIFGRGRILLSGLLFNRNRQSSQRAVSSPRSSTGVTQSTLPASFTVSTPRVSGGCPGGVCPIR